MPMTPIDRRLGLRLLGLHQRIYEISGGLVGHRLGRLELLLLRTTGRRSGEPRTAALLYLSDAGRYIVVGSKGGSDKPPGWLLNLEADPEVEVQVGTRRFDAISRKSTPAERERLWPKLVRLWPDYDRYQSQTRRKIPVVILTPTN